jgi:hypothetical protein
VQVVEATNFKGHEIQTTIDGELLEKGFYVGRRVALTKRMSINWTQDGKDTKKYADLAKDSVGYIQGVAKGVPIINFVSGDLSASVAIKLQNLTLDLPDAASSSGSGSSGAAPADTKAMKKHKEKLKQFEFLDVKEGETVEVDTTWAANLATTANETKLKSLNSRLGMTLATVIEMVPTYGLEDFHVVTRNSKVEVWAAKDYPPNTIVLAPETNEWKDRLWSQSRSVLVKYGTQ